MRTKLGIFAALILIGLTASSAFGVVATLTPAAAATNEQYQQTQNSPCVFGDPSCKDPAGWPGETSIQGPGVCCNTWGGGTPISSPTYTGQQIFNATGTLHFAIGIDVNQLGGSPADSPHLTWFAEYINGVLVASYGVSGSTSGGFALVFPNNGNGFADDLITGFVAPNLGDTVYFTLTYYGADDGTEQFFLINPGVTPTVPEPSSILLLGSGLMGVAGAVRRKLRG